MEFSKRAAVPSCVLVSTMGEESVLLNVETEVYFGLDAMGVRMWEVVTNSPSIEAAYGKLADEFDVEPEVLRHQLTELLVQLVQHGLLKVLPADVESIPAI